MFDTPLHPATKAQLEQALASPAHAYLFAGPPFSYKQQAAEALAVQLAGAVMLPSPNVYVLQPEQSGRVKINQIKELLAWLSRTAHNPITYRGVIIGSAHTMTADAQGALLKMLEEPADRIVFLLVSDNTEGILPTIQSRTQRVLFRPLAIEEGGMAPRLREMLTADPAAREAYEIADELAVDFVQGSLTQRFAVAKLAYEKHLGERVVARIEELLRQDLLAQATGSKQVRSAMACERYIRQNINQRLCIENLALEFAQ